MSKDPLTRMRELREEKHDIYAQMGEVGSGNRRVAEEVDFLSQS